MSIIAPAAEAPCVVLAVFCLEKKENKDGGLELEMSQSVKLDVKCKNIPTC